MQMTYTRTTLEAPFVVARLLACINVIKNWMESNKIKIIADKIQQLWLGTPSNAKTSRETRRVVSCVLRTILDHELIMLPYANSIVRGSVDVFITNSGYDHH